MKQRSKLKMRVIGGDVIGPTKKLNTSGQANITNTTSSADALGEEKKRDSYMISLITEKKKIHHDGTGPRINRLINKLSH